MQQTRNVISALFAVNCTHEGTRPHTLVGCEFDGEVYRIVWRSDSPKLSSEMHCPGSKTLFPCQAPIE